MKKRSTRLKVRDYLIYVTVGLALVAFALLYAVHSVKTGSNGQLPLRWIGLGGATFLTFWAALKPYRHYWSWPHVRWVVAALFVIHLVVFCFVLTHVEQWPIVWFVPTSLFEGAVIIVVIDRVIRFASLQRHHEHRKHGRLGGSDGT
jgi:hypothetical protein